MHERPRLPPFTEAVAHRKVRAAEDAWKARDPAHVALAYTPESHWRNRSRFLSGRAAIEAFLIEQWGKELDYRLIKELWAFTDDRIAVRFVYESRDADGRWWRSHGNENWFLTPTATWPNAMLASTTSPSRKPTGCFAGRWVPGQRISPACRHSDCERECAPARRPAAERPRPGDPVAARCAQHRRHVDPGRRQLPEGRGSSPAVAGSTPRRRGAGPVDLTAPTSRSRAANA